MASNDNSNLREDTRTIDPSISPGRRGEDDNVGPLRESIAEDQSSQDSAREGDFERERRGPAPVGGSGEIGAERPVAASRADDESNGTAAFAGRSERGSSEASLLEDGEASDLRARWTACQERFVDEPRDSVKSADELVAEVMKKVASEFASTRKSLEKQWDRGDRVSTEDLRLAMQRYREFFNRLLAA
jgi:hypothetical protein